MRSSHVSMRFSTQTLLLQQGDVLLVVLLSGAVHAWLVYDRIGTEAETPRKAPTRMTLRSMAAPFRNDLNYCRSVKIGLTQSLHFVP